MTAERLYLRTADDLPHAATDDDTVAKDWLARCGEILTDAKRITGGQAVIHYPSRCPGCFPGWTLKKGKKLDG